MNSSLFPKNLPVVAAIAVVVSATVRTDAATTPAASSTAEVPAVAATDPLYVVADRPDLAVIVSRELEQRLPRSHEEVRVEAVDGRVTLSGHVEIYPDRDRAQEIAEGVRGVESVVNELTVRPRESIPDAEIAENIRATLDADGGTADLALDVAVKNGVVTLTGEVETDPQRRVAAYLASRVLGVAGLNNRIAVKPVQRDDAVIRRQLQRHYQTNALFNDDNIHVSVADGVVRLSGRIDSARERTWAQIDAWVPGVKRVDASSLSTHADPEPLLSAASGDRISDDDISDAIQQLYVFDPRINSLTPDISVRDGIVTLSGFVSTPKARQAAIQIAQHTGGVVDVVDQLDVQATAGRSDHDLAAALRVALESNAVVEAEKIDVSVEEGRATLTGDAADAFAKWTAGDVAERMRGIVAVDNKISVRNEPPVFSSEGFFYPTAQSYQPLFPAPPSRESYSSDSDLERNVRSQLNLNAYTDRLGVDVDAQHGVVTLRGSVDSSLQRRAAANTAYQAGARQVINQLQISERD